MAVAAPSPRRLSGQSQRASYHTPRRRKLTPEQAVAIRLRAGSRSLRELGAAFGVSHETIRAVLRRSPFTAPYRRQSRDGAEAAPELAYPTRKA